MEVRVGAAWDGGPWSKGWPTGQRPPGVEDRTAAGVGGPWSKGRAPGVEVRVGTDRGWLGWGSVVKGPPGVEDRGSGRGYGGSVQVGPLLWGSVVKGQPTGGGGPGRGSVQVGPLLWGSVGESEADWGKRGNPLGRFPDGFRTDHHLTSKGGPFWLIAGGHSRC